MNDTLAAEMRFSIIPEWVTYADISDKALRLYSVLARYADNQTHEAFPSRETLAGRMNCSTSSVDRATEELINIGAVTKKQRHNSSLVYTLKVTQSVITVGEGGSSPVTRGVVTSDELTRTTELEPLNDIQHLEQDRQQRLIQEFNSFWEIYPRKLGKGEAKGAFVKAVDKFGADVVLEGVTRFASDPNLPAPQFIPRAATWLNQERWDDEPYSAVDPASIPGVQKGVSKSPYVGGPREWVQDLHDIGEHYECRPGEFGCK
jgi:hypothetical protein